MSKNQPIKDVTKATHQWTEAITFCLILAVIAGSFFALNINKGNQGKVLASQLPSCGWNSTVPATTPHIETANLFTNPSVEDMDENQTYPQNWQPNSWGKNNSRFVHQQGGTTGQKSLEITYGAPEDGDAKWINTQAIPVKGNATYLFQDMYQANVETEIMAEVTLEDQTKEYLALADVIASTEWKQLNISFTTPEKSQTINIFHTIKLAGYLKTDDYFLAEYQPKPLPTPMLSLTFDDGTSAIYKYGLPLMDKYGFVSTQYVVTQPIVQPNSYYYISKSELQTFIHKGHEIGSHTLTHKNLTAVDQQTRIHEMVQPQKDLFDLVGSTAKDFATPYGLYNQAVIDLAKQHYCSHRSTDSGYNSPDYFDLYNIKVQNIEIDTSIYEVEEWIDYAQANNMWLVLVFHEIMPDGGQYSYSPDNFAKVLKLVDDKNIKTTTMAEGITIMQATQKQLGLINQ